MATARAGMPFGKADRLANADLSTAPDHVRADVPRMGGAGWHGSSGPDCRGRRRAWRSVRHSICASDRLKADRKRVIGALVKFSAAATPYSPGWCARRGDDRRQAPSERAGRAGLPEGLVRGAGRGQPARRAPGRRQGRRAGARPLRRRRRQDTGARRAMGNKGQIVATDSDRTRLAPIFDRLKRAGARNVQVREAGAAASMLPADGRGPDRRAAPDRRLAPPAGCEMEAHRARARRAAGRAGGAASPPTRYVKPGGRLVYVTCSLLPEENTDQIAAFLAVNPDFGWSRRRKSPPGRSLGRSGASRHQRACLSPRQTATDGFFIAMLGKRTKLRPKP